MVCRMKKILLVLLLAFPIHSFAQPKFDYKCPASPDRCTYANQVWAYCKGDLNTRWKKLKQDVNAALAQVADRRAFCQAQGIPLYPPQLCDQKIMQVLLPAMNSAFSFLSYLHGECIQAKRGEECRRNDMGPELRDACDAISRMMRSARVLRRNPFAWKNWLRNTLSAIWNAIDSRCRKMRTEAKGPGCCAAPGVAAAFQDGDFESFLKSLQSSDSKALSHDDRRILTAVTKGSIIVPGGIDPKITGKDFCVLPPSKPTEEPTEPPQPPAPTATQTSTTTPTVIPSPSVTAEPHISVTPEVTSAPTLIPSPSVTAEHHFSLTPVVTTAPY